MKDENKEKLIQDALNMLDDELILETDEIREKSVSSTIEHSSIMRNKKTWRYITTIAASVAVFFIAGTIWNEVIVPNQPEQMESIVEESVEDDVMNYADRNQNTDTVTGEKEQGGDELNDTPDISEGAQSESQKLLGQEQIHLPCQPVGDMEEELQIDELRKVKEIEDLNSFMEACEQIIQLLYEDIIETVKEAF